MPVWPEKTLRGFDMHTVKIKIAANGGCRIAQPQANHGPKALTYAIFDVPDDVDAEAVRRKVSEIALAHSQDDPAGYEYFWSELENLKRGDIINRYRPPGRPPLPPELRRTARLSMRTYQDVADKAARVGTAAVEAAIRLT